MTAPISNGEAGSSVRTKINELISHLNSLTPTGQAAITAANPAALRDAAGAASAEQGQFALPAYQFAAGSDRDFWRAEYAPSVSRSTPVVISEADFDALLDYDVSTPYYVQQRGVFFSGEWVSDNGGVYTPSGSDMHVAKTGNDTTGDGSSGNPYLTIEKGVAELTSGNTLWIHEGTYAEDDGSGYLRISGESFAAMTYIRAVPGDEVIMTNVSGSFVLRFLATNANITIKGIELQATGSISNYIHSSGGSELSNIRFVDCKITEANSVSSLVNISSSGTNSDLRFIRCEFSGSGVAEARINNVDDIAFVGCKWTQSGAVAASFVRVLNNCSGDIYFSGNLLSSSGATGGTIIAQLGADTGGSVTRVNANKISGLNAVRISGSSGNDVEVLIRDNEISTSGKGIILLEDIDGGSVLRNQITAGTGGGTGNTGLGVPADASVTRPVANLLVAGNVVSSAGGHSLLVSSVGDGINLRNNKSDASVGGDFGFVLKGENITVDGLEIAGGTGAGLYLKGVQNSSIDRVRITAADANGNAIQYALGNGVQDNEQVSGVTVRRVEVAASAGNVISAPAGTIGAGMDVDDIAYTLTGTATWGELLGELLSSLPDLQAAWLSETGTSQEGRSIEYAAP